MRVDRGHLRWAVGSLGVAALGALIYVAEGRRAPDASRAGSWVGLGFGVAAALGVVFASLLGAQRRLARRRPSHAATWLKGHLWLGALSLWLALLHAGFRLGGPSSSGLLLTLSAVVATGLFGLALQHVLPRMMTAELASEVPFDRIEHAVAQLRREADALVAAVIEASGAPEREVLARFHREVLVPFLASPTSGGPLASATSAELAFDALGVALPPGLREPLPRLQAICEAVRQRRRQAVLHRWLHGWLLAHIPLGLACLVWTIVHAVLSLAY